MHTPEAAPHSKPPLARLGAEEIDEVVLSGMARRYFGCLRSSSGGTLIDPGNLGLRLAGNSIIPLTAGAVIRLDSISGCSLPPPLG